MKATEAAKLADVIISDNGTVVVKNNIGLWIHAKSGILAPLETYERDYTPLVPLKTYKVGDMVTFAEALQSGMCFKYSLTTYRVENGLLKLWNGSWQDCLHPVNAYMGIRYTIVPDPSVPKKPTIKDLPTGTIFRATLNSTSYDCVRGFNNNFYLDESYPISCSNPHWTLTHIKRNGEWEPV